MVQTIPFDNSYARLPARFYARLDPTPVRRPGLIKLNTALAEELGIMPDALTEDVLAGNTVPAGAEPIALAYAGHQFGQFVPQLGDGRAILLGEVAAPGGQRRDIQLKGSGPTPFSRRGDGRAAIGPVLREYLVSEAMAALGVPTTRALGAAATGEQVLRETALPGAVLARVAASHIRVGTFQYFAARGDAEAVRLLADYAIRRHAPELAEADNPYAAFLAEVARRQAELVAHWLSVGFVHGVMNTDNCSIAGETIDYGPCAFIDAYDPAAVFSSIDGAGRYAYGNQPRIAQWNVARLAETLLPMLAEDEAAAMETAREALSGFASRFEAAYQDRMRRKIGLGSSREGDDVLVRDLLTLMAEDGADFTLAFRYLAAAAEDATGEAAVRTLFAHPDRFADWAERWRQRLSRENEPPAVRAAAMRTINPAVIPRNHGIEAAIDAAVSDRTLQPFETMLKALSQPFEEPEQHALMLPPTEGERVLQTFCGT